MERLLMEYPTAHGSFLFLSSNILRTSEVFGRAIHTVSETHAQGVTKLKEALVNQVMLNSEFRFFVDVVLHFETTMLQPSN